MNRGFECSRSAAPVGLVSFRHRIALRESDVAPGVEKARPGGDNAFLCLALSQGNSKTGASRSVSIARALLLPKPFRCIELPECWERGKHKDTEPATILHLCKSSWLSPITNRHSTLSTHLRIRDPISSLLRRVAPTNSFGGGCCFDLKSSPNKFGNATQRAAY